MRIMMKTNLPELRHESGITQGELANKVGVRRETIVRMEKGLYVPSLKLAMDIADVFGKTVYEVFSFKE
ncbi:MAG: helix-turn-helix transcriptional regulator [Oscillospiraceae bacterium]|nr:helix-turn-helix transcriptional regulator [Oscillospiraceae bacterium]